MAAKRMLFTGNANPLLAQKIAENLNIPLAKALVSQFSDGETRVEIFEGVRGIDAFIVQSTNPPTNNHLMEILQLSDALRRASADRITAVVPYFGYARQDKRIGGAHVPITAKIVADLFQGVGIERVLTVDLHADQIQGFFSVPVDNVYGSKLFIEDMIHKNYQEPVIVSPDMGGMMRARALAKRLNGADLALIDKRRPHPNEAQIMNVVGEVDGRLCIIVDDMVDTAGTICGAAAALQAKGASKIVAYCTHPILSTDSIQKIEVSPLAELVVTDSIPLSKASLASNKIRQLSLAPILAEAINQIAKFD